MQTWHMGKYLALIFLGSTQLSPSNVFESRRTYRSSLKPDNVDKVLSVIDFLLLFIVSSYIAKLTQVFFFFPWDLFCIMVSAIK